MGLGFILRHGWILFAFKELSSTHTQTDKRKKEKRSKDIHRYSPHLHGVGSYWDMGLGFILRHGWILLAFKELSSTHTKTDKRKTDKRKKEKKQGYSPIHTSFAWGWLPLGHGFILRHGWILLAFKELSSTHTKAKKRAKKKSKKIKKSLQHAGFQSGPPPQY
jgi:hypothetical protein